MNSRTNCEKCKTIKSNIIKMTAHAQGGHYLSSLSCVEVIQAIFQSFEDAKMMQGSLHKFILSKGHAAPALYAVMAYYGFFPEDELLTLRHIHSRLQGHPALHFLSCLDSSSGSLGQGLSIAIGIGLAARLDKHKSHIFVLLGDGECQEGQVWEAAMAASHFNLHNIIAIVDNNTQQISGDTNEVMSLQPFDEKWKSFGWEVLIIDGHNSEAIFEAIRTGMEDTKKPTLIIANTIKGWGIPFLEKNLYYHTIPLSSEQLNQCYEIFQ